MKGTEYRISSISGDTKHLYVIWIKTKPCATKRMRKYAKSEYEAILIMLKVISLLWSSFYGYLWAIWLICQSITFDFGMIGSLTCLSKMPLDSDGLDWEHSVMIWNFNFVLCDRLRHTSYIYSTISQTHRHLHCTEKI